MSWDNLWLRLLVLSFGARPLTRVWAVLLLRAVTIRSSRTFAILVACVVIYVVRLFRCYRLSSAVGPLSSGLDVTLNVRTFSSGIVCRRLITDRATR